MGKMLKDKLLSFSTFIEPLTSNVMKSLIIYITMFLIAFTVKANNETSSSKKVRVVAVQKGQGDVKSISNELDIYVPVRVFMPNAFTPDGDGLNDTFGAVGEGISEYHLVVFNRWGEVVFESLDVNTKWDGYVASEKAPAGAYSYQVKGKGFEFGYFELSGSVLVL